MSVINKETTKRLLKNQICKDCTHWRWETPSTSGMGYCTAYRGHMSTLNTCEEWSPSFSAAISTAIFDSEL